MACYFTKDVFKFKKPKNIQTKKSELPFGWGDGEPPTPDEELSNTETPISSHSKKPWVNDIPIPDARLADSFEEILSDKCDTDYTSESIIRYIRGTKAFITPGAYFDYLSISKEQDTVKTWDDLVWLVSQSEEWSDYTVKKAAQELHNLRFKNENYKFYFHLTHS